MTPVASLDPSRYQIVLINNSRAALGEGLQGVMHQAEILFPDPDAERVINSMMLAVSREPIEPNPELSSEHLLSLPVAKGY